jgi:hypothetical protein
MLRALRTAAALLALTVAVPALARADEPSPPIEVPLRVGAAISGRVESFDSKEVVLLVGPEQRRRVPWSQVAPIGVYRVRAALARPEDGAARLALAELASELGLWEEARREFEKAHALGSIDARAMRTAVAEAETRALDAGLALAERLTDAGDVEGALEVARRLKIDFGGAADATRVDRLVARLVERVKAREAELLAEKEALDRVVLDADRKREILARLTEAKQKAAVGDREGVAAREHMAKGVVSRARRSVEAADAAYVAARRELGRLRRIVRAGEPERDQALALLATLDTTHYRLLFDAAKYFWDERVYGTADEYAARASYVDPVDPDLLELRQLLRERRIRYRASDHTNTSPSSPSRR